MTLTRYEFEVLTYIERNGNKEYPMRKLSDEIKISGNQIKQTVASLISKGLLVNSDNYYALNEESYKALKPYKVEKAVVLAAGFGSRMMPATADRPKPMVSVNGKRIIETLLDALVNAEVTDITIVRGYKKEVFDEILVKYPFVKLVDNDDYDKTNNISSAMLVLDKIDNSYLCEADLYITNPDIITKYQYASNILGSYSLETDDWSFKLKDGYIDEYQKGNTYCYNYYGISFWNKEDSEKLRRDFAHIYNDVENGKDYFWEFVPLVLLHDDYKVEIRQCNKEDIMEIDNYYELQELDSSYK